MTSQTVQGRDSARPVMWRIGWWERSKVAVMRPKYNFDRTSKLTSKSEPKKIDD